MNQQLLNKIFCDGTWSHKYNEARNEKMAHDINEPNDRTSYDVGTEMEPLTDNNK